MTSRKPFDFLRIHVIYPATSGGSLRPQTMLIAEN
jgi:hypothetical protein